MDESGKQSSSVEVLFLWCNVLNGLVMLAKWNIYSQILPICLFFGIAV
jgi:hypothetical protein